MPLKIREIAFGDLDAKSELQKQQIKETNLFVDYFIFLAGVDVNSFRQGTAYIVSGLKGTGKTALLRYLDIEAQQEGDLTHFVLFKSHIFEDERRSISKQAGYSLNETSSASPIEQDFKSVWLWFLHQKIVFAITEADGAKVFRRDSAWDEYAKLVRGSAGPKEWGWISKIIPRFKKGNIEVEADLEFIKAKFGADLVWVDGKPTVPLPRLVDRANIGLAQLTASEGNLNIFIDELEAFNETPEQFNRDLRLIRDLVFSVHYLNDFLTNRKIPIRIACALRSEVMNSVFQFGGEISRIVSDFGVRLTWSEDLLLQMVERRIHASERWYGMEKSKNVWTYFPPRIDKMPVQKYLVYNSLFRPRDIIRLLKLAQARAGSETIMSEKGFVDARKEFSSQMWIEITEELLAIYTPAEIGLIRRSLSNFRRQFYLEELKRRVTDVVPSEQCGRKLLQRRTPLVIAEDLYRIGVIGNDYEVKGGYARTRRNRWIFRGDDFMLEEERLGIHRSLWNYLSIPSRG